MTVLCQAKVFELNENEIADIYLYGGVVWFHPGDDFEKPHYHVAKYVASPEDLEEMIYCLCDQIVIANCLSWNDWVVFFASSGNKVFPLETDDIEVYNGSDCFYLDDDLLM